MADYKYAIFDAQYFLTRNFMAMKNAPYLSEDELVKSFFYSIAKYLRDFVSADKVICLWDKWPYYSTTLLGDTYKGDRYYASEDELEGLDPEKDKEEIERIEFELRVNKIKQNSKYWIINNLDKLGIVSFLKSGYEADNFAYIISKHLMSDDRKSVIISIDSDWKYLISEKVDYAHSKTGEIITLEDMNKEIPEGLDISLYKYKSIIDSLYGSHNNMLRSLRTDLTSFNIKDCIESVLKGELTYFNSENELELFNKNLSSFNIDDYPEIDKVRKMMYYLDKKGSIMDESEYSNFRIFNNFKVSSDYYKSFSNSLNKSLYIDNNDDKN